MMKQYYYYAALLAATLVLGGCSKSPAASEITTIPAADPGTTPAVTTAAPEATTPETLMITDPSTIESSMPSGFTFSPSEDVVLYMHEEAAPVLDALGEPLTYMEAPSCAFLGTDRIYGFGSYEVTTYEKDQKEYIYDIYFLDDSVTTDEGIYIGCSKADMEAAYGTGYEEMSGSFTYTKDGTTLQFIIENDIISAIRYNGSLGAVTQ